MTEPLEAENTQAKSFHIEFSIEEEDQFRRYLHYLSSSKALFWRHFLAGTAHGLGFLFGSAIILGIVSFILSNLLSELPLINKLSEALNQWIQTQTTLAP